MLRYIILLISLACMSLMCTNFAIFHFTVICMKSSSDNTTISNSEGDERDFTSFEESILFATVSVGRIIGSYPAVKLFDLCGMKTSFTIFGILTGIGSIIVPVLGNSFIVILIHRIIQGFGLASAFLALGVIPTSCGNDKEKSFFVSLLSCSLQLGPCLIMPVSGFFCTSTAGWHGAYYFAGFSTIAAFFVFYFTYKETNQSNRPDQVSPLESAEPKTIDAIDSSVIIDEPANEKSTEALKVPYLQILASPSFWGIMIVAFGDTIGYHVFLLYGPIYINKVLGFEVTSTGVLAAFPYIFSIATKALGGVFLDRATCIKERLRVLLFVSLSQLAMTLCFVVLLFITPDMSFVGQAMLTLMTVFSGMAFVGLMSGSQIISQQFNYIVTSALAIQDSLAGLAVPVLVAFAAPHYDKDEWILVFHILIGLLVATNVLFVALTKVKPAKWTQ
ncbi:hypothetical protein QR680_010579 [Steinernema hermaphroditum]|uniref:Major facilitator superfamily (MFS) profile domain-containing protein n=1 Tax=Steinernema hermaphroditum TaxID=289476 RepID=A0AA39IQX7_9BILA|nr:hypothetical protein QR680_010579 [Steinernema hermaphroditum]